MDLRTQSDLGATLVLSNGIHLLQKPRVLQTDCEDGDRPFYRNSHSNFAKAWLLCVTTQKVFCCVTMHELCKYKLLAEKFLIENENVMLISRTVATFIASSNSRRSICMFSASLVVSCNRDCCCCLSVTVWLLTLPADDITFIFLRLPHKLCWQIFCCRLGIFRVVVLFVYCCTDRIYWLLFCQVDCRSTDTAQCY